MNKTAPRFVVIVHIPTYDDRDCIAFWTLTRAATTMTAAWAHKVAEVRSDEGEYPTEVRDIATGERVRRVFVEDSFSTYGDPFSGDPYGDGVPF